MTPNISTAYSNGKLVFQSFDVTIATIESMESVGADSMEQFADDLYDYCQLR